MPRPTPQPPLLATFVAIAAVVGLLPALALSPTAHAAIGLDSPVSTAVESSVHDVLLHDMDGDGELDLVVSNTATSTLSLMLGHGDGSFASAIAVPVSGPPTRISVADFDNDGHDDVVVTIPSLQQVEVLWGDSGSTGLSTASSTLSTSPNAAANAIGTDFNGDGRDDLVISDMLLHLTVHRSQPDRGFGPSSAQMIGLKPHDLAPIRISGRATQDVAALIEGPSTVYVATHAIITGFQNAGTYMLGGYGGSGWPAAMAVADVTGDGRDDIVTADGYNRYVTLVAGHPIAGMEREQVTQLPGSLTPRATNGDVSTGDVTGDGVADAIVLDFGREEIAVLRSVGPTSPLELVATYPSGPSPIRSTSGDLNGDGIADVALTAATGHVRVLLSRGTPTISGQASDPVAAGGTLSVSATFAGGTPNAGGSIRFRLYAPGDTTCADPVFAESVSVSGDGTYAPAGTPTAARAGGYRWTATYGGDTTNDAVATNCGDSALMTTVSQRTTQLSLTAPSPITVGDYAPVPTATLSDGYSPTGTIRFSAYRDADCSSLAYADDATVVSGVGPYSPPPDQFVPSAAGTYHWVARYSGDDANEARDTACNGTDTTLTVEQVTPTLSVAAAPSIGLGDAASATVTFTDSWIPTAAVTLSAYADDQCSGPAVYVSDPIAIDVGTTFTAGPEFVPAHAGEYRWVATFPGDVSNRSSASSCGASGSITVVDRVTPQIVVAATSAPFGQPIGATAALTAARAGAGGSVVLSAYADAACATAPAYVSAALVVDGPGNYAGPIFVPDAAGAYRWVARYSGDDDHAPVASSCGIAAATSTVAAPPPTVVPPIGVPGPPVPGPPAVVPPAGGSSPEPTPLLSQVAASRRCLTATARTATMRYTLGERARVTFTVQRHTRGARSAVTSCPMPTSRAARNVGGSFRTLRRAAKPMRRTVTVGAGNQRQALRSLTGNARLAPGLYRVQIDARTTAGGRTSRATVPLWVLKPRTTRGAPRAS